jgi:hypothetical protein
MSGLPADRARCLVGWPGGLVGWLFGRLCELPGLADWPGWLGGQSVRLAGRLAVIVAGCQAGYMAVCLAGSQADWLSGLTAVHSDRQDWWHACCPSGCLAGCLSGLPDWPCLRADYMAGWPGWLAVPARWLAGWPGWQSDRGG